MALVSTGYILTVTVIDNGRNRSTLRYQLRSADFATAVTDSATILAALQDVTQAEITGYQISELFREDAVILPGYGIHVEDKASVTCQLTTGGGKKANFKIPAPVSGIFQATQDQGANIVDVTDSLLVAYGNIFKSTGQAYISDGEDLDLLISGKRIHAKSNFG